MTIRVIGAGVAGLTCAYEFACAGETVEIIERAAAPGLGCSFDAGGMISPWCEEEGAEPFIVAGGQEALDYWTKTIPAATVRGRSSSCRRATGRIFCALRGLRPIIKR